MNCYSRNCIINLNLEMSKSGLNKIPYWDGKAESFGVYISKIKAYAKFVGVGDVLDPVLM